MHTPDGSRCDPHYPRDPSRFRIEEPAAALMRQLFPWYADDGLSMHAIAARLMRRRMPTYPGGLHGQPATVGGMLRNAVYAGTASGKRDDEVDPTRGRGGRSAPERQRPHTRQRPREAWIAVEVPPIIARALCERGQALRPLRQAQSRRNNTRQQYLLRARVSGAACGLAAPGRPQGRPAYDVCNGPQSRVQTGRAQCCAVRTMGAERLDPLVWDAICRLLSTPQGSTAALRRAHAGALLADDTSERVPQLQRARRKAERQIERFVDALTAEVLTLEELKTRRTGLQERLRIFTPHERELRRGQ
jgi:site-specific DNA recombinase